MKPTVQFEVDRCLECYYHDETNGIEGPARWCDHPKNGIEKRSRQITNDDYYADFPSWCPLVNNKDKPICSNKNDIAIFVELIGKLDEYIELIGKELDETSISASIRGWRSSRVKQGEKLRNEIDVLRAKGIKINVKVYTDPVMGGVV